jgi:hypothetical protein
MTDLTVTGNNNEISSGASIYTTNIWLVSGITCFIYLFFNWYLQTQVLRDQVYSYSLGRQVNPDKLAAFLQGQHRMILVSYMIVPLTLLVKISLVSLCLLTGLLLTSLKLPFRTLVRITLFAESAFLAGTLLRLLIFAFSHNVESLGEYMRFAPLSLYSLFKSTAIPNWLTYPLQTLDIFQIGYVLLLAAGLHYYIGQPFKKMLNLVLMSYGLGLACCMIGFAFISVSFNP